MSTRREEEEVMDDREERIHFITYIAYLNCSVAKSLSLITVYSPPALVGVQMIVEEERGAHSFCHFFISLKADA